MGPAWQRLGVGSGGERWVRVSISSAGFEKGLRKSFSENVEMLPKLISWCIVLQIV
jgi:hypothetical protein